MPGMDSDVLLDALEHADQLQLIRPPKGRAREPRFVFTHELIRQTLLDSLFLPRRQRLHLQVAEAMETVYAGDLDGHAGTIGHHLFQSGAAADLDKTAAFLQRGQAQRSIGHPDEAIEDLRDPGNAAACPACQRTARGVARESGSICSD